MTQGVYFAARSTRSGRWAAVAVIVGVALIVAELHFWPGRTVLLAAAPVWTGRQLHTNPLTAAGSGQIPPADGAGVSPGVGRGTPCPVETSAVPARAAAPVNRPAAAARVTPAAAMGTRLASTPAGVTR